MPEFKSRPGRPDKFWSPERYKERENERIEKKAVIVTALRTLVEEKRAQ